MSPTRWIAVAALGCWLTHPVGLPAAEPLLLHARAQVPDTTAAGGWQERQTLLRWDAARSAMIVCDMWDRHWCRGATERVAEMAPRMNAVLRAARDRGVTIIHAPSDTMAFYADTTQRRRAREAPPAVKPGDGRWRALDRSQEPPLPIDDSDGGCDDQPACAQDQPWRRQTAALEIAAEDYVSDRGGEIINVLEQRGITNVIVLGVHANMCVLGRSFAIRALVGGGRNVLLMRDLTDTMYNSRQRPFVSHFAGTDLVVRHIERHWCPSITSVDFLGGEPFRFAADQRPRVVMLIGEDEYRTWETLPAFAREALGWRGFDVVTITNEPAARHRFPALTAALARADLLVLSTRRRALPAADLAALRAHLAAGKPLLGIRTASHAFAVRGEERAALAAAGLAEWPEFDPEVLGGNYRGHHGEGPLTTVALVPEAKSHPILTGLPSDGFKGHGSLYRSGPLAADTTALLLGQIPAQPGEPLAWTRRFGPKQARVFYTSLGHERDFAEPAFRRLLLNAVCWCLERPVPPADSE